jgi:hypothetical protein
MQWRAAFQQEHRDMTRADIEAELATAGKTPLQVLAKSAPVADFVA